jgi:hypothetical protein
MSVNGIVTVIRAGVFRHTKKALRLRLLAALGCVLRLETQHALQRRQQHRTLWQLTRYLIAKATRGAGGRAGGAGRSAVANRDAG